MNTSALLKKGWNDKEIRKAEAILKKEEKIDVFFSKLVFWTVLIVILFANILVSLILVPFLIVFTPLILYLVIIILAGAIGFLYNFLINDIQHLERRHHALASIIIPLIALINMLLVVVISNKFITKLQINVSEHNPWLIAIVFAAAFIFPYVIDRIRISLRESKKAILVK